LDSCAGLFTYGNSCLDNCNGKFQYNNLCLDSCTANNKKNYGLNTCLDSCSGRFSYGNDWCLDSCAGKQQYGSSVCLDDCSGGKFKYGVFCLDSCENKFLYSSSSGNECLDSCTGKFSYGLNVCLDNCSGKFTHGNSCVDACPVGTFDPGNRICQNCDQICGACVGSARNCINCMHGELINTLNGQCVISCPAGTFEGWTEEDPARKCYPCSLKGCTQCSASNNVVSCTACVNTRYLKPSVELCILAEECESPFIRIEAPTKSCVFCHHHCQTCDGTTSTSCLSCGSSRFYKPDTKECVLNCPGTGYYKTSTSCLKCHPSCQYCNGITENDCLLCPIGRFENNLSECVPDCGNGFWNDPATQKCQPCHYSCADCFDSSESKCIGCNTGYQLRPDNTCREPCPQGTVPIQSGGEFLCMRCHTSCAQCNGITEFDCMGCKTGFKLTSENKCVQTCLEGTFESTPEVCSDCHPSCKSCNNFGKRACLTCQPGLLYLKAFGSCHEPPCPMKSF
jgi:proprotein convertase subtilisin/kexin type 5